jgi:OmpA family
MRYAILLYTCILFCAITAPHTAFAQSSDTLTLYHAFDQYRITTQHRRQLDSFLAKQSNRHFTINIEAGADPVGTESYNQRLVLQRAQAVWQYLAASGIDTADIAYSGAFHNSKWMSGLPHRAKRKTLITVRRSAHLFKGEKGVEVTTDGDSTLTIAEFTDAASMLRNNMYAVDAEENILQTAGMIRICRADGVRKGKYYEVKAPSWYGNVDTLMQVWNGAMNRNGQMRWQRDASIRVSYNKAEGYYLFRFPLRGLDSCIYINLDLRPDSVVYVATERAVTFYTLELAGSNGQLRFSAKLNDSLYAFVQPAQQRYMPVAEMRFSGRAKINGIDSLIRIPLYQCLPSRYEGRPPGVLYTICDACLQPVNYAGPVKQVAAPPAPQLQPVKKKKGFFAWVRRLFGGR